MTHTLVLRHHHPEGLDISVNGQPARHYTWQWLRDHSNDPASVHPDTMQRQVDTFLLPPDLHANNTRLTETRTGQVLELTWSNGETSHCASQLFAEVAKPAAPDHLEAQQVLSSSRQPWASAGTLPGLPPHSGPAVLADQEVCDSWLNDVAVYGFGLVANIDPTKEGATA